ncbi:MAG: type III pantothenate kinase [Pseudomonadales bacterium]
MILEIDVGNSALKWRVVDTQGCALDKGRSLLASINMLGEVSLNYPFVKLARISCVASAEVRQKLAQEVFDLWGIEGRFAETKKSYAGLSIAYVDPARLGVDRWVAMLAAHREAAGPVCVFDCGSAITVDLVEEKGLHKGGYIVPGLGMQRESLLRNTGQIRVEALVSADRFGWGVSTEEAIDFGLSRMVAGFIDDIVGELLERRVMPVLFLTGGDAELLLPLLKHALLFKLRPELVLDGLRVALP